MWKEVRGYEGYYEVSDDGVVRSVDRVVTKSNGVKQPRKSHVMPQKMNADGYMFVKLSRDGITKNFPVHRLVALEFVDGFEPGLEVNHIDCNRANNNSSNLEWVTHAENVAYTKSLKRHVSDRDLTGENNPNYGNRKLHERYARDSSFRRLQNRPGASNGRSRPIRIIYDDGSEASFDYLREAAKSLIENGYTGKSRSLNDIATNLRLSAEAGRKCYGVTPVLI